MFDETGSLARQGGELSWQVYRKKGMSWRQGYAELV